MEMTLFSRSTSRHESPHISPRRMPVLTARKYAMSASSSKSSSAMCSSRIGLRLEGAARGVHLVAGVLDQDAVFHEIVEGPPDRLVYLVEVGSARGFARERVPRAHVGVHLLERRAGDLGHIRITDMTAGGLEEPLVGLVRVVGELTGRAPAPHEVVGALLEGRAGALPHGVVLDLLDEIAQRLLGRWVVAGVDAVDRVRALYLPVRGSSPIGTRSCHLRHLDLGLSFSSWMMEPSPVTLAMLIASSLETSLHHRGIRGIGDSRRASRN